MNDLSMRIVKARQGLKHWQAVGMEHRKDCDLCQAAKESRGGLLTPTAFVLDWHLTDVWKAHRKGCPICQLLA
jgi:hypothetical protein